MPVLLELIVPTLTIYLVLFLAPVLWALRWTVLELTLQEAYAGHGEPGKALAVALKNIHIYSHEEVDVLESTGKCMREDGAEGVFELGFEG